MQSTADARGKAGQVHEARQGRCEGQGKANARGKAWQMCDAKHGRCAN
jgi:hypothetical protein